MLGIVLLRVWVANTNVEFGDNIVSIANALVIMFFNGFYGFIATKLNDWGEY